MNPALLRTLLFAGCWFSAATGGWAQIEVTLSLENNSFMKYEPIVAHVKVYNTTGHSIGLFNHDNKPWLTFYVAKQNGEEVSTLGKEYDLHQAQIAGGDALTVNVDLTPVYDIRQSGMYHVVAIVYSASYGQRFKSDVKQFDLTAGSVLWQTTVALLPTNPPPATAEVSTNLMMPASTNEDARTYVLVSSHVDTGYRLYARVENEAKNLIYGTIPLGVLVGFGKPEARIDRRSHLHVLHQVGSRAYAYADITPDARVVQQRTYSNYASRPELKAEDDGTVHVVGGEQTYPNPAMFPAGGTELPLPDSPAPAK